MTIPEYSIIIPTYNEKGNPSLISEKIISVLEGMFDFEIVFVDDDSPDLTWKECETLAVSDSRIRVLRRTGRRGLNSAVLEGMSLGRGNYFAVMDADLQHDPGILPEMFVLSKKNDIVIGSRYSENGGADSFTFFRKILSAAGTLVSRFFSGTEVKDPLSGYFVINKSIYCKVKDSISQKGFKILLEILLICRDDRTAEVSYKFGKRTNGVSKIGILIVIEAVRSLFFRRNTFRRKVDRHIQETF